MNNKIFVTRSSMPPIEEYFNEIKDIWESHWLTNMGPKHDLFQDRLKEYLGVSNIELFVNGHMALELTLQAMNLQGKIITTPFTFASTTHAIVRNGLTPVFCDIDPITYTIDVNKIESLITDRTCAILPVHVYGNICNIKEIDRIAQKYEIKVIYDAAHTFGEFYEGKEIGSFGDASIFSFHATKVFNSIEGGAVCFRDKALGQKLLDLKNFGIHGEEDVASIGANAKMNEFCAAMGICNLKHVNAEIDKRKVLDERYRKHLKNIDGLILNVEQSGVKRNYAYFPIIIDPKKFGSSRSDVAKKLEEENIYTRKYFYPLTNSFSAFHGKYSIDETPVAMYISRRVLALPIYVGLNVEDIDRICDTIISMKNI